MKNSLWTKRLIKNFDKKYILAISGILLHAVLVLLSSYTVSYLIENVLIHRSKGQLGYAFIMCFLIGITCSITSIFLEQYYPLELEINNSMGISKKVMSNLMRLSPADYDKREKGYYFNVASNSAYICGEIINTMCTKWIANILIVLLVLGIMLRINLLIGLIFMLYIPTSACAVVKPSEWTGEYQRKGMPEQDTLLTVLRNIIDYKREIVIGKNQKFFIQKLEEANQKYKKFILHFRLYQILSASIPSILNRLYGVIVLGICAMLYFQNKITIGEIVFVSQTLSFVSEPITIIFEQVVRMKTNDENFIRVEQIDNEAVKESDFGHLYTNDDNILMHNFHIFSDVEKKNLLYKVENIKVNQGEFVVIKGANGSGKSMLINYLTSNTDYRFAKGEIRIDKAVQNYSMLTYPIVLVNGSFNDNMFGIQPKQEIVSMLGIDFEDKEIRTNPINLSFGEQQKINLLRVLSTESDYIFLDEPLTNLDENTRKNLVRYLKKIKDKKTIVIISHSPEFDSMASQVLLIESGIMKSIR